MEYTAGESNRIVFTGFCLGANYAELLGLYYDRPALSFGGGSTREAFKFYKSWFKKRLPNMSRSDRNALLDDRARRLLFSMGDTHDKIPYFGCQIAGHYCTTNGSHEIVEPTRNQVRTHYKDPKMDNHMLFVHAASMFVFSEDQSETKCSTGLEFSLAARKTAVPWIASCRPKPFF
jgi:hypothetical protein